MLASNIKQYLLTLFFSFVVLPLAIAQADDNIFDGIHTVVIDPGHGGKDAGCLGSSSYEKDIALDISLMLGKYIEENFKDIEVIYTRKTDVFIELDERAQIANRNNADLFICVHANAASPSAFGTETYVMGISQSESNLQVAKRENSVILMEEDHEKRYGSFDPNSPESYIALSLMQSAYQAQSLSFAAKVQEQFRERVGRRDRGVKQAAFWVLHRTSMPSVLIETGFLTNASEEKFLKSEVGKDYMASAIYRAFKEYKYEIDAKVLPLDEEGISAMERPIIDSENSVTEKERNASHAKKMKYEGLTFKVQLVTSSTKISTEPENFKGILGVEYYEAGGLYRYTVGNEDDWEAASKLQDSIRAKGYEDAFVVAFLNGDRIAVGEAVKLLKKNL